MKSLLVFVTLAVSVLGAPTTAVTQGQQAGIAHGGLVGAVVSPVANVAATGVKAVVTDNNIANNVGNDLHADILKRTDAAAQAVQGGAASGLVAVPANILGNVGATVVDADVECNDIGNDVLNNADIKILSRRDAITQADQHGAAAGTVAAVVNAVANADVKGVVADVEYNNIANNVANHPNVHIGKRTEALSQAGQGAAALGAIAAAVNGDVNAAVTGVKGTVAYNDIANDVLNNANVDILKRQEAAAQAAQGGIAKGGLAGLDINALINGALKGADVNVQNNEILNNVLNDLKLSVLSRRSDGPTGIAQADQQSAAKGGIAGVDANAVLNLVAKVVDLTVKHNNILNNVGNNADIRVLSP